MVARFPQTDEPSDGASPIQRRLPVTARALRQGSENLVRLRMGNASAGRWPEQALQVELEVAVDGAVVLAALADRAVADD